MTPNEKFGSKWDITKALPAYPSITISLNLFARQYVKIENGNNKTQVPTPSAILLSVKKVLAAMVMLITESANNIKPNTRSELGEFVL